MSLLPRSSGLAVLAVLSCAAACGDDGTTAGPSGASGNAGVGGQATGGSTGAGASAGKTGSAGSAQGGTTSGGSAGKGAAGSATSAGAGGTASAGTGGTTSAGAGGSAGGTAGSAGSGLPNGGAAGAAAGGKAGQAGTGAAAGAAGSGNAGAGGTKGPGGAAGASGSGAAGASGSGAAGSGGQSGQGGGNNGCAQACGTSEVCVAGTCKLSCFDTPAGCTGKCPAAKPLMGMSFQGGTIPKNVTQEQAQGSTDELSVVPAPWDAKQKAVKFVIRPGDSWNGTGYPRTELTLQGQKNMVLWHKTYRYATSFYWPADTVFPTGKVPKENTMLAPFQMHGDDGLSPLFSNLLVNGNQQLSFQRAQDNTSYKVLPLGAIPTGKLVEVDVVFRPSDGDDGYLIIQNHGQTVAELTGANDRTNVGQKAGYWKQGLYDFWSTSKVPMTLYMGDLNIYSCD